MAGRKRGSFRPGSRPGALEHYKGLKQEAEVVLVDVELVPKFWDDISRILHWGGATYDTDSLRPKLLIGTSRVWLAIFTRSKVVNPLCGVIVTTVTDEAPKLPNPYRDNRYLKDLYDFTARSLLAYFAGRNRSCWFDSAVERISQYGQEQKCRQLFCHLFQTTSHISPNRNIDAGRFLGKFEAVMVACDNGYRKVAVRPERHARTHFVFRSMAYFTPKKEAACPGSTTTTPSS